uniref:MD-2-related lipid-recognition domain-containing protein n=1 Tax=Stomoxys calcitrans TaxID=35570 RepID=A0A1I8NZN3_STOCA
MLNKILCLLVAFNCLIIDQAIEKKKLNVELHQVTCTSLKPKPIEQLKCYFKKLGRSKYSVGGIVMLNQQLEKTVDVQVKLYIGSDRKVIKFLDLRLNVCEILQRGVSVPLMRKIIMETFKRTNFPRKCPIKSNIFFNASYILDDSFLPPYLPPSLGINFSADFFDNRKKFATVLLEGCTMPIARK